MTEEREMTAPMTSVGTEVGQSPNVTTDIIPDYGENFNPTAEEMFEVRCSMNRKCRHRQKNEAKRSHCLF